MKQADQLATIRSLECLPGDRTQHHATVHKALAGYHRQVRQRLFGGVGEASLLKLQKPPRYSEVSLAALRAALESDGESTVERDKSEDAGRASLWGTNRNMDDMRLLCTGVVSSMFLSSVTE